MSAAALASIRSQVPTQHHAEFDAKMAALDGQTQGGLLDWLQKLKAFLAGMGLSINFGCILSLWAQIIAALADSSLWPAVLVAYLACAHPTP